MPPKTEPDSFAQTQRMGRLIAKAPSFVRHPKPDSSMPGLFDWWPGGAFGYHTRSVVLSDLRPATTNSWFNSQGCGFEKLSRFFWGYIHVNSANERLLWARTGKIAQVTEGSVPKMGRTVRFGGWGHPPGNLLCLMFVAKTRLAADTPPCNCMRG